MGASLPLPLPVVRSGVALALLLLRVDVPASDSLTLLETSFSVQEAACYYFDPTTRGEKENIKARGGRDPRQGRGAQDRDYKQE